MNVKDDEIDWGKGVIGKFFAGYVCSACALKNRWKWPKGRVTTWHTDECDYCKQQKEVCHTRNWIKPPRSAL